MQFMKRTINESVPIWNECVKTPFVQELKSGALPFEKFKLYMIQDSIYLRHYARVYGKAMYHSTTLKDIQFFYSILSFVTNTESAVRLSYLKQFGITDNEVDLMKPLPENQAYIDFMLRIAEQGNVCEILMAVLPCMLSYSFIFRNIAAQQETANSKHWDFIQDYADEQYYEDCKTWCDFTDKKCALLSVTEQEKLNAIFQRASLLELDFWKMAYQES
ncbi:putative TenA family transcriptional activator [Oscillibacter valericigenes Sjm18-20]|nr:putative TenA family transcriptional activator [Oscillibacter valericigenes Sjm18-20]